MAITNGFITLAQFLASPDVTSTDATDDAFIEDLIERASRFIEGQCGGRTFYARATQTQYYDVPHDRQLDFDDDVLAVTSLTNGDGTAIAATEYDLLPYNDPPYYALRLKMSSTEVWEPTAAGDYERALTVVATLGYVDRAGSDARSVRIVENTAQAALSIALSAYKKRYGQGVEGVAQVTGAGVVITPQDVPQEAWRIIQMYQRRS